MTIDLTSKDWAFVLRRLDAERERLAKSGYSRMADKLKLIHETISRQKKVRDAVAREST